MVFSLFDAPEREPSQFVGFAGNRIDRQSEKRSDVCVAEALGDARCRVMLVTKGRIILREGDAGFAPFHVPRHASALGGLLDEAILLGQSEDGPVLAAVCSTEPDALPGGFKAIDYRSVYMQGLISPEDLGALAQAAALIGWHANHRYCGRCGAETEARAGGYKRVCQGCQTEHFPRTDPVAIMLAVTRDKCLLGRSPHFPPGMYSALAGFIEHGETIEEAVRRETLEEAGVRLGRVVYHASQPWPFPYSLMIGCFGEALNEDLSPDLAELEDCRWFSREEVQLIVRKSHPDGIKIPPRGAIASHLIRAWATD